MLICQVRDDACLAYANTLSWRGRAMSVEELGGFGDLLAWVAGYAGLGADAVGEIDRRAHAQPAMAAARFAEAIALREAIHRIFGALAAGRTIASEDLAALNDALKEAPARDRLASGRDGFAWRIEPAGLTTPVILAPVLWSAGDLLVSDQRKRVRLCANEACQWLFLDESKAGTRRWCDMASCGNRAKARRHYQKTKQF